MTRHHSRDEYAALTHLTQAEAARELGVTPSTVCSAAKRHGLSFNTERSAEQASQRMRQMHANPKHNPLVVLSDHERAEYTTFKKSGYSRAEALSAIGRADLHRTGGDQ